jgi:ribosomal protein S18 acetylase RimI-like enzyme
VTDQGLRVRQAATADVADVAPLFALYREFYGRPYDEPAAAAFLAARLDRGESVVLLAELDGRPVGFTQLYPGFSSVAAAPMWTLNDLYVVEAARGSGAAAALMEQAEVLARQAGAVALELATAHDNVVAQRLYARQGIRRGRRLPALREAAAALRGPQQGLVAEVRDARSAIPVSRSASTASVTACMR